MTDRSRTVTDRTRIIEVPFHADARGVFSKPFSTAGASFDIHELFWSVSARGVVRGMHFQLPPAALHKLVWVSRGSIFDVVVDLRRGPDYGHAETFELDASAGRALWIPPGYAHGFQSLEDGTIVNYATDVPYVRELDTGVRWDSIPVRWPLEPSHISDRDLTFPGLSQFESPFDA